MDKENAHHTEKKKECEDISPKVWVCKSGLVAD